jgi:hypothetical protein
MLVLLGQREDPDPLGLQQLNHVLDRLGSHAPMAAQSLGSRNGIFVTQVKQLRCGKLESLGHPTMQLKRQIACCQSRVALASRERRQATKAHCLGTKRFAVAEIEEFRRIIQGVGQRTHGITARFWGIACL